MVTLQEVLAQGGVRQFPDCGRCGITEEGQKQIGKPFLASVRGLLVCGKCAVELVQPVWCNNCKMQNVGGAKFCNQCGEKFG